MQKQRNRMEPSAHRPWLFPPPLVYKAIRSMSCCLQLTPPPTPRHRVSLFLHHIYYSKNNRNAGQREQRCKTLRNGDNSPKHMWMTGSRVDPSSKDWVLSGVLRRPRCHLTQRHPAWPIVKS
jgi:hypothetical protein